MHLRKKIISHIGYNALLMHCVILCVSSNCLHEKVHSHFGCNWLHCYAFLLLCICKAAVELWKNLSGKMVKCRWHAHTYNILVQYYIVSRAKPIQYQCGFIPPSQVSHSHFITIQYKLKCNRCGNIFESKINWRFILLSCIPKCDQCGNISPSTKSAFTLPDLSKFDGVEFIMVVWPTTKLAFALPDFQKLMDYIF